MTEPTFKFRTSTYESFAQAKPHETDILFVGVGVDDRGSQAINELSSTSGTVVELLYDPEKNELVVNGAIQGLRALVNLVRGKKVRVESTTLGLAEIIRVIQASKSAGLQEIEFTYLEPKTYTQGKSPVGTYLNARDFELTENRVFRAIHGFAHQRMADTKECYIFFLGYEVSRLLQAFEQPDLQVEEKYAVFGVPPFVSGWETNALANHAADLKRLDFRAIHYCAANSVREAYLKLWAIYSRLRNEHLTLVISPLGTKPQTVASALFLIETKGGPYPTALYYDHPQRKQGRSSDVRLWHFYKVNW
ncbi:MAG: hypothetical protein AABM64_09350 [Pseudomonadota bacterium]